MAIETSAWQLLQRRADPDAFARLYREHNRAVYNYCFRRLADWTAADDATQAVFLALWRRAGAGRVEPMRDGSELAVLLGMARQECLTATRTQIRRERLADKVASQPAADAAPTPEVWAEAQETMRQIHDALAELPDDQRDVIELVCWSQLTLVEAAAALRVPLGTVKSRLARGRAKLSESDLADLLGGAR